MLLGFAVGPQVWAGQYMTLLHFNDLHGHLEASAHNDTSVGGMARIAAAIQQVEAWNDNHQVVTLLLNAGDVLQGTAMSTMFQGSRISGASMRLAPTRCAWVITSSTSDSRCFPSG